jgi:hypothetical protein
LYLTGITIHLRCVARNSDHNTTEAVTQHRKQYLITYFSLFSVDKYFMIPFYLQSVPSTFSKSRRKVNPFP